MERNAFFPSTTQYCPLRPFEEADGKTYIYAVAHGTLTAKTPYLVIANEYGNLTKAAADVTVYCYVGVPLEAVASGGLAKLQIGGYIEDVICASDSYGVGQACKFYDGGLVCTDADYTGAASEFAVATAATSSAETVDLMLIPERILTTT